MKSWLSALALLCLITFARADVPIVQRGISEFTIVVPKKASAQEELAAAELSHYLQRISDKEFKIAHGPTTGKMLVVSEVSHLGSIFKVLGFQVPLDPDGYEVVAKGPNVCFIGATGRSTLYAVYRFLDSDGCRFLSPQFSHYKGSAEVVPRSPDISLLHDLKASPILSFRKLYVEEGHSHTAENLEQMIEWMPKVGYNTLVIPTNYQGHGKVNWDNWREALTPELQKRGITIEVGGHGYQNFLNADMEDGHLFDQHPEYFGQDTAGNRHRETQWVFCTSNTEAVDYLTRNFVAYLKARTEIQIYDFWPPDAAHWCECDKCRALGSPSDRQAILIAQIKRAVAKVRPNVRLEVLAYHTSITPPEHEKIDKSVLLDYCPINQQFDFAIDDPAATINADYTRHLLEWRKAFDGDISIYSYYRKYAWDSLPVIIPHYMQRNLQWYAKIPIQGVSTYSEPGDWATYELNHYILVALAWNPDSDVDALIHKFCDSRYGPTSPQAISCLKTLEDVEHKYAALPNSTLKPAKDIADAGDKIRAAIDDLDKISPSLTDAGHRLATARLKLMCQYAIADLEIQQARAENHIDSMREKAIALHDFLEFHASDGVFLVDQQRISLARMLARYGAKPAPPQAH